jgi:hypothetical protein
MDAGKGAAVMNLDSVGGAVTVIERGIEMSLSNTSASRVRLGSCGAGLMDFRPDEEQHQQYTITETYPSLTDMKRRLHVDKEK